uniref:MFS domain-containing protein n=1 Tax=Syphacia muris TaxID=451379 RepID=A0A0N5AQK4_9BILA
MESSVQPVPLLSFRSVRLRVGVLMLAALCIEGLMRSNLNMAMVCMNGKLVWSTKEQGWIFAAYYIGTLLIVIPGTYLIDTFGATFVVQFGAVVNAIGTFLTPVTSEFLGPYALLFIRFCMGAGQGILQPCTSVLIAHWFPQQERSFAVGLSTAGNQLSIIIAMVFTAGLCQVSVLGGWPAAFYLHGIIGLVLCVLWYSYVKDVPTCYKGISDAELSYITGGSSERGQKRMPIDVPWKNILLSLPVWATALSSFSQSFATVGMVTYIPLYYRVVLRMNLTANGILSAAPFLSQLLSKIIFVYVATVATRHGFSLTVVTKVCNLIAALGTAACYICLIFLDCGSKWIAISMICMAMALLSGYVPGYQTGIVSIAPKYTAAIASFCRLTGNIASVVSPALIGWIAKKGSLDEWRIIFIVMTVTLLATGTCYQLWGSADAESWAQDTGKDESAQKLVPKGELILSDKVQHDINVPQNATYHFSCNVD